MNKAFEQIKIDKRSNSSIPTQIFLSLFNLIKDNKLQNLTVMPQIDKLADYLNVDPQDVKRAYDFLIENQYIKQDQNRFLVSYTEINTELISKTNSITKSIIASGHTANIEFIYGRKIKPPVEFFEQSNYDRNEPIYEIKRLFKADNLPIIVIRTYISLLRLPEFDKLYDGVMPFDDFLQKQYGILYRDSKRHMKVIKMPTKDAQLLNELPGTATFLTSLNFIDQNESVIGYSEIITSSHFAFSFHIPI